MSFSRAGLVLLLVLVLSYLSSAAFAMSEEERSFLLMYFKEEELQVVSATRSLKSITRVAENVEVVTKDDIELMNAHTVAEALYFVTGVEISVFVGPGAQGEIGIHGSDYTRVAVLLDGVPLQNENNAVAAGILPVQMIERIEIIKGPASSIWGSSFGGVINIITKSAGGGDHINGLAYASGGEHATSDVRAELNGRKGPIGVYLFGGAMNSSGLIDSHFFHHNNFFSKFTVDAGEKTKIDLSFFYHKDDSVQWDYLFIDYDAFDAYKQEQVYGRASLQSALSNDLDLNVSGWIFNTNTDIYEKTVSTNEPIFDSGSSFDKYGFSGSLTWRAGAHTIVAGTDVLNGKSKANIYPGGDVEQRKYAFFANDTISLGSLTITPGLRYDHSNLGGDIVSPSLGVTYLLSKDLLLRALVSRGFHDPGITSFFDDPSVGFVGNTGIKPEKIWSYQIGAEANVANILSTKLTLFLHDIDDIILDKDLGDGSFTSENGGKEKTIGGEIEIITKKYRGFILKAGAHYESVKLDNFSDIRLFDNTKRYGFNTSLSYDEGKGLRAVLKGHYLWWNEPSFWDAKYNGVVMDFNVIKEILTRNNATLEAFFTGHNIFNASSYDNNFLMNPNRWIEAGIRCKF
ncbi:MAG: TonB-dependent receptor [Nitrospiraceae bacterium]|nr:TonB-dependent receptor [Nitrospiraceae bacterium]